VTTPSSAGVNTASYICISEAGLRTGIRKPLAMTMAGYSNIPATAALSRRASARPRSSRNRSAATAVAAGAAAIAISKGSMLFL
jgi:hypothetical protein